MEIKERKPHLKWRREASRGSSNTLPLLVHRRPNRKLGTWLVHTRVQEEEKKKKKSPANERLSQLSRGKTIIFQNPRLLQWTFFYKSPPHYPHPLSSVEECSPLFCWLDYGFAVACLSQIRILCFFQINPFCWWNNWLFYFQGWLYSKSDQINL